MKVLCANNISFQRKLKPNEEAGFKETLERAKNLVGSNGNSTLIVPASALMQRPENNTGIGNLASKESGDFFNFAKQYWGINTVQLITEGEYSQRKKGEFKPYSGTTFSLGTHLIEPELLTTKEFSNLLSKEDIKEIIESNTAENKDTRVNFENVLDTNSKMDEKLRKAFAELNKSDTEDKQKMLKEIKEFSLKNKDWLESKSVFEILKKYYGNSYVRTWEDIDRLLYNTDFVNLEERNTRIEEIKKINNEGKFFEFKQFLANKHLKLAKDNLNSKGIKLNGDMAVGFSFDEVWANPKAFLKGISIGWGLPALDMESKEAENLLKRKVSLYAQRYDGIRIDAGWAYIKQPHSLKIYNDKFLNIIEDAVKQVKGADFNLENINYEFIGANFSTQQNYLKDRCKIHCTNKEIYTLLYDSKDIIGATNHDTFPMKLQFKEAVSRDFQARQLASILKIPQENIASLNEFIKAKFAQAYNSKNNMIFYIDALNLNGTYQQNRNVSEDYRIKIPHTYQEDYFKSLEKGEGFNIMDTLEKLFKAKGLDQKEKGLYKKIVKYKNILEGKKSTNYKTLVLAGVGAFLTGILLYLITKKDLPKNHSQDIK